ncbi:MAG TPA: NupC/NupG family nucleoside CNT transporter, partial [Elusimicrobia bacterium]|nr:NupC/NupG family nucleoside CNT transporter [Elusimicrobiota bacterium]
MGLQLALNVAGCLIAFMSLLAMLNFLIGWSGGLFGVAGLSLQKIFGFIFAPLAWIMGVPWKDCFIIGNLMGVKTALNEFVAYFDFAVFIKDNPGVLAERSMIIATYAL